MEFIYWKCELKFCSNYGQWYNYLCSSSSTHVTKAVRDHVLIETVGLERGLVKLALQMNIDNIS